MAEKEPSGVPLGAALVEPTTKNISAPVDLCGKRVALNLKAQGCTGWVKLPASMAMITEENPVYDIPEKGLIEADDLNVLFRLYKKGYLVISDVPIPRYVKSEQVLLSHMENFRKPMNVEFVRGHIIKIVNGPYIHGGHTKLDILNHLLFMEKGELKGVVGLKRPSVIKILQDAVEHVQNIQGGVSKPRSEREEGIIAPSSSGRSMSQRSNVDPRKFLESD